MPLPLRLPPVVGVELLPPAVAPSLLSLLLPGLQYSSTLKHSPATVGTRVGVGVDQYSTDRFRARGSGCPKG